MQNYNFFDLKTDLADESNEILRSKSHDAKEIETTIDKKDGFDIFTMNITGKRGEEQSGKKQGRYVTANFGNTHFYDSSTFERACNVLAEIMGQFVSGKPSEATFLLAGLGNPSVIADSVGAQTASNFIVTRHIKSASPALFEKFGFAESSAIIPDVFGNTGIEAAEIIAGVVEDIKPSYVIAVDALSSRRLSRLGTTVQICDTGICPGSGVGNARMEISSETLGVPVIAIGVPTVVNASTLITDALCECGVDTESLQSKAKASLFEHVGNDCYVSPKNCADQIKSISKLIGYSLNAAIHKNIGFSEMRDFL